MIHYVKPYNMGPNTWALVYGPGPTQAELRRVILEYSSSVFHRRLAGGEAIRCELRVQKRD